MEVSLCRKEDREVMIFSQNFSGRGKDNRWRDCRRDSLKFSGHTTDFTDVIESMEVDNQSVPKAVAGDFIGIKVSDRVRPGDEVFKVIPD
jgi:peptide subunit release factor RF-3